MQRVERPVTDCLPERGGSIAANDIDIKISISFAVTQHFLMFYGGLALDEIAS
jgi:hypothetical protein